MNFVAVDRTVWFVAAAIWCGTTFPTWAQGSPEEGLQFRMEFKLHEYQRDQILSDLKNQEEEIQSRWKQLSASVDQRLASFPPNPLLCLREEVKKLNAVPAISEDRIITITSEGQQKEQIRSRRASSDISPAISESNVQALEDLIAKYLPDDVWQDLSSSRKLQTLITIKRAVHSFPSSTRGVELEDFERAARLGNLEIELRGLSGAAVLEIENREELIDQRETLFDEILLEYKKLQPEAMKSDDYRKSVRSMLMSTWVPVHVNDSNPAFKAPLPKSEFTNLINRLKKEFTILCINCSRPIDQKLFAPDGISIEEQIELFPGLTVLRSASGLRSVATLVQGTYARYAAEHTFANIDLNAGISKQEMDVNRNRVFKALERERQRQDHSSQAQVEAFVREWEADREAGRKALAEAMETEEASSRLETDRTSRWQILIIVNVCFFAVVVLIFLLRKKLLSH